MSGSSSYLVLLALTVLTLVNGETNEAPDELESEDPEMETLDLRSCFAPPLECPSVNVTFHLYTRSTTDHELDYSDEQALKNAPFVPDRPIKILIHGYTGNKNFQPNSDIRPALLAHGEYNIISVDWGRLAASPCYIQATKNVELAGMCTARLIEALVQVRQLPLDIFHVIGFSLGAQVTGQVAKYLAPNKLKRITGLDPAMPLFATLRRSSVLDRTDARFVDIIHTNSGNKGKLGPNGHVDFYVNGGKMQLGCTAPDIYDPASCSHARAPMYYAESITSDVGFWGQECSSWLTFRFGLCNWGTARMTLMGEFADPTVHGQFFLNTNPQAPFAKGLDGLAGISRAVNDYEVDEV